MVVFGISLVVLEIPGVASEIFVVDFASCVVVSLISVDVF